MKVCSCREIREAENRLIESGCSAWTLMNQAAVRIAAAIARFYPEPGLCIAFAGKGNNGGDAIAVLGILQKIGWDVELVHPYPMDEWSELTARQFSLLSHPLRKRLKGSGRSPSRILILDGLLGLGGKGSLRPEIAERCRSINHMRRSSGAVHTWAIDLPTGVDGDTGEADRDAVIADHTSVIGGVKQGLLEDCATKYVGRLVPIPLDNLDLSHVQGEDIVIEANLLRRLLAHRPYELFKNQAGHVGIIAGSCSMPGAARLCAEAALRAGAGLVTLFVPEELYSVLASALPAEVMIRKVSRFGECEVGGFQSLLVGPGLGYVDSEQARELKAVIDGFSGSIVLDADGLNCAAREGWRLGPNVLATPHPGEMRRLLHWEGKERVSRREMVESFVRQHDAALVYKGARSIVTAAGLPLFFNSSGGPAMATAGQGDVLAGVCAGWCAQGVGPVQAAILSVYLCGYASDILLASGRQTEQTLCASDTLGALRNAIRYISESTLP